MNRKEWEAQVFASDLNPTARMVCIALGSHGNWVKDQEVRPSKQRIAGMTGLSRDTAGRYIDALEEQGWLKHIRTLEKNIKVYELSNPSVVVSYGILAIKKRGSTGSLKNQSVVVDNDNSTEPVVVDDRSSCRRLQEPVVVDNEAVVVDYDSNLKNLLEEPTREPTTSDTTVSDEPVASPNYEIKEEAKVKRFLNSGELRELERLCFSFNVDESDASLIKNMLMRGEGSRTANSFTEKVKGLMEDIGIKTGSDDW